MKRPEVDGVLITWGERLFYPSNRIVRIPPTPRLDTPTLRKAAVIRHRITALAARRAPQVMVKVTGGGRGMGAIAAHFRYISKHGRLPIEDDRGVVRQGRDVLHDFADQWRFGGSRIDDVSSRREAFNLMLSMPVGTDARCLLHAAREFAKAELEGHRYVMVLHEHQANPHVHLCVRAESRSGQRLNPRKADLHRWRETFAEKLRGWGIDAEATRQPTRGVTRNYEPLWRVKAGPEGRLRAATSSSKTSESCRRSRVEAVDNWRHIIRALGASESLEDRQLGQRVAAYVRELPVLREVTKEWQRTAMNGDAQGRTDFGVSRVSTVPQKER